MTLLQSRPDAVPAGCTWLNDVHSRLNHTPVAAVLRPTQPAHVVDAVRSALRRGSSLVAMGARHAMGGQQLLSGGAVLDTGALARVLAFDARAGRVTVEAGIRWPALMDWLAHHPENTDGWTIRQKQTGADDFSLGGALAANIHGRGLALAPFVDDVEAIELVDAHGEVRRASRGENPELFALVIGGYGLFGIVVALTLRLVRRTTLRREVRLLRREALPAAFADAVARGCTYGDFQFAVDPRRKDFLDLGILSCYAPDEGAQPDPAPVALSQGDFASLLRLAHHDPHAAFERYAAHYLASDGQCYASDEQQRGVDLGDYHTAVDADAGHCGSEMITELYVPRASLPTFLADAARALRRHHAQVIYGTVRLIERDTVTHLRWAREPWACVVFNLHVRHDRDGLQRARVAFGALIDVALEHGGSFYLTYHRWATRAQLEAAYPQLPAWLRAKAQHDPRSVFRSDWFNALERMFD